MDHTELLKIVEPLQTPVYVYDGRNILQNARRLKEAFGDYFVYYSIKANPNREVCSALAQLGLGAEVVTEGEIRVALDAGFSAAEMLFAGPGKILGEVKFAIDAGITTITAESVGQLELIDRVARGMNCKIKSLLRINAPELQDEESESMVGLESHFGLDVGSFVAARARIEALTYTTIIGTQYYAGSQILDPGRLAASVNHQIEATRKLTKNLPVRMEMLDIGGGFGIPYQDDEHEFDLDTCARLVHQQIAAANLEPGMRIIVESGRFIVGPAGVFLTRVVDVKEMFGRFYVICDGGMGGFARPMLTRTHHRVEVLGARSDNDHASRDCVVCGPSCSSMDSFGKIWMPPPVIGDVIAVHDAGAYGWSLGLRSFHGVPAPQEVYICRHENNN
jgi:diaminopimelate decarboxylase